MDVSISQKSEAFVDTVVEDGRYASASDVVDEALRLLEERERKLKDLRDTIDASIARGGSNTSEDVHNHVRKTLDDRAATRAHQA